MTTYKTTSGDYTITGDNGLGIFTVNYANTVFNGNLTYTGNLTTVDDFITVAANNTGVITDMGLLAQANTTHFAGLRFNTTANVWQISSSVYSNSHIATLRRLGLNTFFSATAIIKAASNIEAAVNHYLSQDPPDEHVIRGTIPIN